MKTQQFSDKENLSLEQGATREEIEKPKLDPELLKQLHSLDQHPQRLPIFIALYLAAAFALYGLVQAIATPWVYILCLPLYLLAAASLHGISLFTHEGVHGVLSRNYQWNRWLSIFCALPVGQNFSAYKVLHLKHHKHLGIEGDPDHYKNYTKWNWLTFFMHWGRLIIGYPVYIIAIPILGFWQGNKSERVWIAIEVALLGLLVTAVLRSPIPTAFLIHGWLIPMLWINTMVNIRGMSQHTLLEHEADLVRGTRTILTIPLVRFFMCNENYHLEHHLYPAVPWYHLPRLHQELKSDLVQQGAPYIPSYFSFVQDFIAASLQRQPVGTVVIN
ncbi:fatty acid desaturase family protein [Pseudanabaena sp. lw0831]|uniref:fatty acid desaturase family protein n=1 Tax=Pseudanabaena sp. lw0831 TaxID=1357935 RepID=UPI0019157858|nr:fatty acid desaturase [Pseudanabaena sp. lw0831]GBO52557.1 fatty acid desaturase family protein [Pseudanabaena sp. lw0831]